MPAYGRNGKNAGVITTIRYGTWVTVKHTTRVCRTSPTLHVGHGLTYLFRTRNRTSVTCSVRSLGFEPNLRASQARVLSANTKNAMKGNLHSPSTIHFSNDTRTSQWTRSESNRSHHACKARSPPWYMRAHLIQLPMRRAKESNLHPFECLRFSRPVAVLTARPSILSYHKNAEGEGIEPLPFRTPWFSRPVTVHRWHPPFSLFPPYSPITLCFTTWSARWLAAQLSGFRSVLKPWLITIDVSSLT